MKEFCIIYGIICFCLLAVSLYIYYRTNKREPFGEKLHFIVNTDEGVKTIRTDADNHALHLKIIKIYKVVRIDRYDNGVYKESIEKGKFLVKKKI